MKLMDVKPEDIPGMPLLKLDEFHTEIVEARGNYESAKSIASEYHSTMKAMQMKFIGILEALGRTSHKSDKGSFSYYYPDKFKITNKQDFFNYLKETYGPEAFESMVTMNSQSLNSWAKGHTSSETMDEITIPGVERSTGDAIASMRKN